jgi:peptidoglycan/LPS O-acetylase OafA/YrhL
MNGGATSTDAATMATPSSQLGHLAGLDGVRGVAVVAVVTFHLWPHRVPGGFLGVSLFFTLSGYLITRLLLAQAEAGTLSLRQFWGRRLRRLAPASVATIASVTAVWWWAGWWSGELRGEVLAGVSHVANWRQVVVGERYGVDPSSSPLLHLWSLSIEEQVYVVVPLLVWWAGPRAMRWCAGAWVLVAVLATVVHSGNSTLTYYGTHVRMGEVALGALAAAWVHRWGPTVLPRLARWGLGALVVACGGALVVVMTTTSLATEAYTRGGLLAVGALSMVVVAGVVAAPTVGAVVDMAPLRALGRRSYAIYLIHWPVLVGLTQGGVAASVVPWLTVVVTLVLAELSLRLLETPIRQQRWSWPAMRLGVPVTGAVVVAALMAPVAHRVVIDMEAAQRRLDDLLPATTTLPTTAPRTVPTGESSPVVTTPPETTVVAPVPMPLRWGIVGDSKALSLALGMVPVDHAEWNLGAVVAGLGCPLGRSGRVRDEVGAAAFTPPPECDWFERLDEAVEKRGRVEVMLVYFGSWDVRERQVPAFGSRWISFDDVDYQPWLSAEADLLHEMLLAQAATTVQWMTVPVDPAYPHPERFEAYNEFVRQQRQHPSGCVDVIDFAAWVSGDARAQWALPDGIHTTWEPDGGTSRLVGEAWLLEAVHDAVTRARAAGCRGEPLDRQPSPLPLDRG